MSIPYACNLAIGIHINESKVPTLEIKALHCLQRVVILKVQQAK